MGTSSVRESFTGSFQRPTSRVNRPHCPGDGTGRPTPGEGRADLRVTAPLALQPRGRDDLWTLSGRPGSIVFWAFDMTALHTPPPPAGTLCTSWATPSSGFSAPTSSSSWCGPARPSPRILCSSGSPWSKPPPPQRDSGRGAHDPGGAAESRSQQGSSHHKNYRQPCTEAWCMQSLGQGRLGLLATLGKSSLRDPASFLASAWLPFPGGWALTPAPKVSALGWVLHRGPCC